MRRVGTAVVVLVLAIAALAAPVRAAQPVQSDDAPVQEPADRVLEPDRRLGAGWRSSSDRAVTTVGDATGLHVLVADRWDAYRWRTVATLSEPLLESDQWIGQVCVTGSGDRAVVVYAPRTFTNEAVLMERGAFAAMVDLASGEVTKLAERVTLAYYNPSCGVDETAVLSRLERSREAGSPARTWIGIVDTVSASLATQVRPTGQVSSPVMTGGRILAAKGYAVVEVSADGELTVVAETIGQPMRLVPEATGELALQVARSDDVDLARLVNGTVRTVATVPTGAVRLRPGAGGDVYAVGGRATDRLDSARMPATWRVLDGLADSEVSTGGGLLVERAVTGREAAGQLGVMPGSGRPQPVRIDAQLIDASQPVPQRWEFRVQPAAGAPGREPTPAAAGLAPPDRGGAHQPDNAPSADPATVPWDPDRACAVPRNDPTIQVYQPTPLQVEWAADLAVRGQLTFQRPTNWAGNGLPAYSPQGYFPSKPLAGGGHVPAQVMLGVLAQESNMWQASWHAVDALAGNPLTSAGFYGIHWEDQDPTTIDWSEVDCGYGAAQVTTGMHSDDTGQVVNGVVMDYTKQKAVVLDYATNVAAGLRILQDKWNQTRTAGLIANDGDPRYIENWWFALWAYNTGFYPDEGNGQPWGVGWSNNPASPLYPADRQMFLTAPLDVPAEGIDDEIGYDNAKHPNHWSYPERVIGFAYTSLKRYDYHSESWEDTYLTAGIADLFIEVQPDRFTFCVVAVNQCDPTAQHPPGDFPGYPPGPCLRDDLMCWWHEPVTWEPDCVNECGIENRRFTTVEPRPLASPIYDSQCSTSGLPPGAQVIDDIDSASPLGPQGCTRTWATGGSFEMEFESMTGVGGSTVYPGKVDLHQIGGGFGGHFWFTHTLQEAGNEALGVTGRWRIDPVNAWTRVLVHIPDHGAHTRQARYEVTLPNGEEKHRVIPTNYEKHAWVDIGVFDFRGATGATIELSNFTRDGGTGEDIAWDAVAVQPLPKKPDHFVVAVGDSYSSGEGADSFSHVSNQYGDDSFRRNACRRSSETWSRKIHLAGAPSNLGTLADQMHPDVDYHLIACSSARTHNLLTYGTENALGKSAEGQYHELPQIEQGFLDENTTLVTLTIGGNDARFSAVLTGCFVNNPFVGCDEEGFVLTGKGDGAPFRDPEPLYIYEPWLMENLVKPSVEQVVQQIRAAAPNAHIQLIGYPKLFDADDICHAGLSRGEVDFLNDLAVTFEGTYTHLNLLSNVNVMSTVVDFRDHAICSDDPWLNTLDLIPTGGGNTDPPSMNSFHPNSTGYAMEGLWVSERLSAIGYTW